MTDNQDGKNEKKQLDGAEAMARVRSLLGYFRTAMMTTISDESCHTRPMGMQGKSDDFTGALWFFTDRRSRKVSEIERGDRTVLFFQNDGEDSYMQLNGQASIDADRARMKELYNPLIKSWFPEGLDDPNLTLVQFEATSGQYWTSTAGMLEVLLAFAKSVTTGRPGKGGEIGEVQL